MYKTLVRYYDEIFSPDDSAAIFTEGYLQKTLPVLEAGCGTGSLASNLSRNGYNVTGIDISPEMVAEAIRKNNMPGPSLRFLEMNILEIASAFRPQSFGGIVCFGTTMVHLSGAEDISRFLESCDKILVPGGKLLVQIINYDKVLAGKMNTLPVIETKNIVFKRSYEPSGNHILFKTSIEVKKDNKIIEGSVLHYPLRKNELATLLSRNGFTAVDFYSGFNKEIWNEEGMLTLAAASL
jgi:2-polyprenyl-3-methyl-5-hydroxy-6-metoxy-1,4-benzoquinol methylase